MPQYSVINDSQNFELLYTEILKKINQLLSRPEDEFLKKSVLKNVEEIRTWLPKEVKDFDAKKRLHQPAFSALQTTLDILSAIEGLSVQSKYKLNTQTVEPKALMSHLFTGGHVLIDDNGAFLANLQNHTKLFERYSSHYKNEKISEYSANHKAEGDDAEIAKKALESFNKGKPDFSTRAEVIFNELLIGKVTKNGKTYTWLQFEGHSHQPRTAYRNSLVQLLDNFLQLFHYSIEKFQHHLDYLSYRLHGKKQNIGQYGNSIYTETSPIVLEDTEVAQESLPLS